MPFLDEASLVALLRSCKRMRDIATSDFVWEPRLREMRVNTLLVNRTSNFLAVNPRCTGSCWAMLVTGT